MADISDCPGMQTGLWDGSMDHVAYMNPRWKLIPKILSGEKPVESRWYMTKRDPWDRIHPGDTVYFKDSGKPVTARAEVANVRQFSSLNEGQIRMILEEYGRQIGIDDVEKGMKHYSGKRYCILVFLRDPREVERPFEIDKKGYGSGTAWICVPNVDSIRKDL